MYRSGIGTNLALLSFFASGQRALASGLVVLMSRAAHQSESQNRKMRTSKQVSSLRYRSPSHLGSSTPREP